MILRPFLCALLVFVAASAGAAEILSLSPIHDGSADPPGFRLEASVALLAAENPGEFRVRVLRITRDEPLALAPVRSKLPAGGDFKFSVPVRVPPAGDSAQPRIATLEAIVPYRDLDLPRGDHRLIFEIALSGEGFLPLIAKSDTLAITVSDADRPVAAATEEELDRWQFPPQFAPPAPREVPPLVPRRVAPGGFQSESNLPTGRGFLAEVETAEIHFATNRVVHPNLPPTVRTSFLFGTTVAPLSFGTCRVQVLRRSYDEQKAIRGRPLGFGELQNYFTVLETSFAPREAWAGEFAADDVLLYVHGYRNSFEEALIRATQLHLDLDFPGQTVAFSWPSLGKDVVPDETDPNQSRLAYFDDVRAADASASALVETIRALTAGNLQRRVHVIAHSLGNRLLLAALRKLTEESAAPLLDQVVLAAPDVTVDDLLAAAPALTALAARPTLYSSTKDVALRIALRLHAQRGEASPRAGGTLRCYPQIDAVAADRVNSLFAMNGGHSYFAEAPQMVQELKFVFCQRLPAGQRTTLEPRACAADGEQSWELRR
ncbi:MAG: alpha/beta fold hydrolase [Pirellulaceae bacterium]|nr:alpha/beta fold hydrolase [Pirellulaceae bacterium]